MTENLLIEVSVHSLNPTGLTSHFMQADSDCFQVRRQHVEKQVFCDSKINWKDLNN